MALILNIESSTEVCSVALAKDGELICHSEQITGSRHSELLTVFIESVFREAGFEPFQTDAVAVGKGPGSYTGLRIGVSAAKGICYAIDKPLIAISTLEAMADHAFNHSDLFGIENGSDYLFCPMIDARRMEVYCALYNSRGECVEPVSARIIDKESFGHLLRSGIICFFGNGAEKCKNHLNHPNALFLGPEKASARFMCKLADKRYNNNQFEDVAYFEPFYLKDFVATVSKNKVF